MYALVLSYNHNHSFVIVKKKQKIEHNIKHILLDTKYDILAA